MQGMSIVPLTINLIEQDMIQQSFSIPELVALVEGKKTFQNQTGLVLRVTPGTPLEEIYRPYHNSIVTEINGFSPRNLSEAIIATYRPIKNANGSFVTVRFSDNRLLVFDANVFMETNDRLNMAVGMENNYRSSIFSELKSCSCVSGALKIGQDHLICNICNQKMAEVATKDGMVSLKAYTPASNKVLEKELMKGGNNVVEEKMSGIAKEVSGRFGKAIYKGTTNEMREAVSPSTAVTM
ncbi:hypothetical protein MHBO_004294 [Bonamia ostreae]|uniref:Uncharacterized protein n=1 Tax=Bonamia ostreae TaxID=126728 RepID=A0ABV2ASY1_9EUKA